MRAWAAVAVLFLICCWSYCGIKGHSESLYRYIDPSFKIVGQNGSPWKINKVPERINKSALMPRFWASLKIGRAPYDPNHKCFAAGRVFGNFLEEVTGDANEIGLWNICGANFFARKNCKSPICREGITAQCRTPFSLRNERVILGIGWDKRFGGELHAEGGGMASILKIESDWNHPKIGNGSHGPRQRPCGANINFDPSALFGLHLVKLALHDGELIPENDGSNASENYTSQRTDGGEPRSTAFRRGLWVLYGLFFCFPICGVAAYQISKIRPHLAWVPLAAFALLAVAATWQLNQLADQL